MSKVYHQNVTPDVTFNPFLPLPGRLLEVLASYGPVGTAIETCNRDLARAAQCSASAIPGALRTLEARNYIERITSPRGSLIMLTERSGMADRSGAPQRSDQPCADRRVEAGSANPTETPDRSNERSAERSAMPDPPTPPIRYKHDQAQQQQLGARGSLWLALTAAGAAEQVAAEILDKNPDLTIAEFEAMRARAKKRRGVEGDGIGLVFYCLQNNAPLYAPKEAPDARPRRPNAPDRRGRSAGRSVPQPEQPALTREYLQSRPRRGDRVREVPGSGPAAGG
jgi:DNA-binding MarR family transcriptional regulator